MRMVSNSNVIRFKKALMGLPYEERFLRKVTMDDVLARWDRLCRSGYTAEDVCRIANGATMDEADYKRLMSCLNGYL